MCIRDRLLNAEVGDIAELSGSTSFDPDGIITDYLWKIESETGVLEDISGEYTVYEFTKAGNYIVELTITDDKCAKANSDTTTIFVTLKKTTITNSEEEDNNLVLLGGGIAGTLALIGVIGIKYFRNEDEEEDFFDFEEMGPTNLTCPSCSGLITINTDQRPIQVACPMCQSQFIIRE